MMYLILVAVIVTYLFVKFVEPIISMMLEKFQLTQEHKVFKMSFAYIPDTEGGLIHVASTDSTEQYMLLNREL